MPALMKKPKKLTLYNEKDFKEIQGMSQIDYAEHRGVSKQMVHKYIHDKGYISLMSNGNLDVVASDAKLEACLDPSRTGNAEEQRGHKKANEPIASVPETFSDRRLYRLNLQIQRDEMDMEKARGKLIYKKPTEEAFAGKITTVINRLQKISRRIAPTLALETDKLKCEQLVDKEIIEAVEEFC